MADVDLEINRLVLRMAGVDREEGQALADLVVQRLGASTGRLHQARTMGSLNVKVQTNAALTREQLAERVVEAVLGALQ